MKSRYSLILITPILALSNVMITAASKSPKPISPQAIAQKALKARNAHFRHDQIKLLTLLKEYKQLPAQDYDRIITALEREETFPFFNENIKTIDEAFTQFHTTPGFVRTLHKLICTVDNPDVAKGYLHEIETALTLTKEGTPVTAFSVGASAKLSQQEEKLHREFDLKTPNTWFECKNFAWRYKPVRVKNSKSVRQQFLDQRSIIDEHNNKTDEHITFIVQSKQPIPPDWQAWFKEHNIEALMSKKDPESTCQKEN